MRRAIAIMVLSLVGFAFSAEHAVREQYGNLTVLRLKGSWHEMGRQYGSAMTTEMRASLAFANRRENNGADRFLLPDGLPCGIEPLDQLFSGMAEGADMTLAELVRINSLEVVYAEEMLRFFGIGAAGKCSALACWGDKTPDGKVVFGRNYDWLDTFAPLGMVLTLFQPEGSALSVAMINYPGCMYMTTAMNSSGLFMELNSDCFASAENRVEGHHNVWLLWELMLQCRTVDHALRMLESWCGRGPYIIGLADETQAAFYEWGVSSSVCLKKPVDRCYEAVTNHFLRPGWKNLDIAWAGGVNSSMNRRRGMLELAAKCPPRSMSVEQMKQLMAVPVEQGGAKMKITLFQVIASPEKRTMQINFVPDNTWIPFSFPR